MKKSIVYIVLIIIAISLPVAVFANSGPTYWQGYPSSEIMLVKENSPIKVKNEELIFDFSDYEGHSYTIDGKVTATYEMVNPTNDVQQVQMAFPFIEALNSFKLEDIEVSAGGSKIPYSIYLGDVVGNYGNRLEDSKETIFDFASIVNTITDKPYKAKNFAENEKGKLYTINVKPTTDQRINFAVDFNFDFGKTKVLAKGFNRYERNDEKTRIAAWCYEPIALEIYVLGEDIDLVINAYTDGELQTKTDLLTYQISTQEVELKTYLMDYAINTDGINSEIASGVQLYNMRAKALDKCFEQNEGFSSDSDFSEQWYLRRIITIVYNVEFPQNSEKEVSVRYKTSGTMDMTKTAKPLYSFDYILNPAKNWSDFKNLNVKIITPQKAPYIVQSSVGLVKEKNNIYSAALETLPEEDLSFTLYGNERITLLDKVKGKMRRSFGYFAPIVVGAVGILFIIVLIIVVLAKEKSSDKGIK